MNTSTTTLPQNLRFFGWLSIRNEIVRASEKTVQISKKLLQLVSIIDFYFFQFLHFFLHNLEWKWSRNLWQTVKNSWSFWFHFWTFCEVWYLYIALCMFLLIDLENYSGTCVFIINLWNLGTIWYYNTSISCIKNGTFWKKVRFIIKQNWAKLSSHNTSWYITVLQCYHFQIPIGR